MKIIMKKIIVLLFLIIPSQVMAQNINDKITHLIYFTARCCPNCQKVSPKLLEKDILKADYLVFEYELRGNDENNKLFKKYIDDFKVANGVPVLITGNNKNFSIIGGQPILDKFNEITTSNQGIPIIFPNGVASSFERLDLTKMPALPSIWYKNKIAIKKDIKSQANESIKEFLLKGNLPLNSVQTKNVYVNIAGKSVEFKKAYKFNGWILMYR
ncbi:MAG: hypothetical protein BWY78_00186 [Alphaproteobacteria bacterium ADurb.Bin438]|nr:MAG: hypothetical protein BWY78_00186 [Alphaproteobacteria bacterium ADurb.Bin438]